MDAIYIIDQVEIAIYGNIYEFADAALYEKPQRVFSRLVDKLGKEELYAFFTDKKDMVHQYIPQERMEFDWVDDDDILSDALMDKERVDGYISAVENSGEIIKVFHFYQPWEKAVKRFGCINPIYINFNGVKHLGISRGKEKFVTPAIDLPPGISMPCLDDYVMGVSSN